MMNETPTPQRNPETHKKYRRESFWQITFPLLIGVLLILGLAIWSVIAATNGGNVSQPADTSLIFLICPAMIMSIIPLALVGGLAYGVIMLNKNIPFWGFKAQEAMQRVRDGVKTGTDKMVEPIIKYKSKMASLDALKRK